MFCFKSICLKTPTDLNPHRSHLQHRTSEKRHGNTLFLWDRRFGSRQETDTADAVPIVEWCEERTRHLVRR